MMVEPLATPQQASTDGTVALHVKPAEPMVVTLKVASSSRPHLVAGAIAAILRDGHVADMQCVGAGAVNQGVKAIAIAAGYVTRDQLDVMCRPSFADIVIEGQKRTAIHLVIAGCQRAATVFNEL